MDESNSISYWYVERSRLVTLCERIEDFNVEVTKSFSHNFKGLVVNIGGLEFPVTEESIAQAIGVAPEG